MTVALLGVLTVIALPGLRDFATRNAVAGASDELARAFARARMEAAVRNAAVTVCKAKDAETPSVGCADGEVGWHGGWMAFADGAELGRFESGEQVLFVGRAPGFVSSSGEPLGTRSAITFPPIGPLNGVAGAYQIEIHGETTAGRVARSICISALGQVEVRKEGGC